MKTKFYLYLSLFIAFAFLGFIVSLYPAQFLFREQNKTDTIATIMIFVAVAIGLMLSIISQIRSSRKKPLSQTIKETAALLLIAVIPYVFLRPVLIGIILFVNANLGTPHHITITGKIVDLKLRQSKGETSEVHLLDAKGNRLEFTTFPEQTKFLSHGNEFKMEMTEGCLGLKYKLKTP